jgi:hypothetical protein
MIGGLPAHLLGCHIAYGSEHAAGLGVRHRGVFRRGED